MPDAVILSNRVITPEGMRRAAILFQKGKIISVTDEPPPGNYPLHDFGSSIIMSGITDPHVHLNEPGHTNWEGFDSGTKSALAGGITTLIDMPLNSIPVTTTRRALEQKIESSKGKLHVNCGFWGGIVPGNKDDIEELVEAGVFGFKAFLANSGIEEFQYVTETHLHKIMPILADHGLPLLVHCELEEALPPSPNGMPSGISYNAYLRSRPSNVEDEAISMMIRLCEKYNCHTHIVHLSSADSINAIQKAKEKGLPLTVETAQHYLYFNGENIKDGNTLLKCAPPIREKENNDRLWEALKDGIIDFVATDHSPSLASMKELSSGNFFKAWGGISSIQLSLPVLWTAARQRGVTPEKIASWLSENPVKLLGNKTQKGKIAKGYDADFVIWEPESSFEVTKEMLLHKNPESPYVNEKLWGSVHQTWLGGTCIFEKDQLMFLNRGEILLRK